MAVPSSERQRDIFPLPFLREDPFLKSPHASRSVRQRALHSKHSLSWANRGIDALNQLAGRARNFTKLDPPSASAVACTNRIRQAYIDAGPPRDAPAPEEAPRQLLKNSPVFSQDRLGVQPYAEERISWPEKGARPVSLLDSLPQPDRSWLQGWEGHMLRDPSDVKAKRASLGVSRPCIDPTLMQSEACYGGFAKRLHSCGMLRWTRAAGRSSSLGVLFVVKKSGQLRIIFDTRVLNCDFKDPPAPRRRCCPQLLLSLPWRYLVRVSCTWQRAIFLTASTAWKSLIVYLTASQFLACAPGS